MKQRYVIAASMASVLATPAHANTVVLLPDATVTPYPGPGGFDYVYSLGTDPSVSATAGTYVNPPNPDTTAGTGFVTLTIITRSWDQSRAPAPTYP